MAIKALAFDYDGTLATNGQVEEPTLKALNRAREAGYRLFLVTGRVMPDLLSIFPQISIFERVIGENGALLYTPQSGTTKRLVEPPPAAFAEALSHRGVKPLSLGEVVVAMWRPHEVIALEVIREQGLELSVTFNKSAVMVLPAGVNKATGVQAICKELGLTADSIAAVGDAENDYAMLKLCGYAVALANAVDGLKQEADLVTVSRNGSGVIEFIEALLENRLPPVRSPAPV